MARAARTSCLTIEACQSAARVCICFTLRKAVRVATQIFDEALRPVDLRCTRFVTLLAIRLLGATDMGTLAESGVSDPTTVSCGVKPLRRRGLITRAVGVDQRKRLIMLTPAGYQILSDAYPYWQSAQADIARWLGQRRLDALHEGLNALVERVQAVDRPEPTKRALARG
jgi:DNA-binding MarR family transcriptional regulator